MNLQCHFALHIIVKQSVLTLLLLAIEFSSNAQSDWVWFQDLGYVCYNTNNSIKSICELNGEIWVAKNQYVVEMDTGTGTYQVFDFEDFPSFDYGEFVSITSNGTDKIYVAYVSCYNTTRGLLEYDGSTWKNFPCEELNTIDWAGTPFQVASNGHVFTAVANQVAEFDGLNWSIHTSPLGNIYCGGMDAADTVWLATMGDGNIIRYYNESFQTVLDSSTAFYTMAVNANGQVFVPSWLNGTAITIKFSHGTLDTFDFPWSQWWTYASPMATDTAGNLIMVNQDVVYFLQGQDWIPQYLPVNYGEHSALYCDPVNNVWIGYSNGMLVRLRDGQVTIFNLSYSALPSDTVLAISSYHGLETVVGTSNGLAVIDGNDFTAKAVFNHNNSILESDRINCLSKDYYPNSLPSQWIGTNTGLYLWDFDTTWNHFTTQNSPLPNDTINAVRGTSDVGIWIGTNGGLAYFDEDTTWMVFTNQNSGIPSNKIQCLHYQYPAVFIGTDSGVAIYDGTTWQILTTFNSGLLSNDITAIARTYFGLFIGTRSNGLCDSIFANSNWTYHNSSSGFGSDSIISVYGGHVYSWQLGYNEVFVGTSGGGMYSVFENGSFDGKTDVQGIEFRNAYDASQNDAYWGFYDWVGTEKGILFSAIYGGVNESNNQSTSAVAYFDPNSLNIRANWSQFVSPEIQVFDLQGRFLFNYHPGRLNDQQLVRIPANNISPQIYLIRIQSGNSSIALKAIKPE